MFQRNNLDQLLAFDKRPAVSIYLPTHPAGREVRRGGVVSLVDRTRLPPDGPAAAILRY